MNVTFNPMISYKKNNANRAQRPNNAQYMTFGSFVDKIKTAEDFFKDSPNIHTFLVCLGEHTPEKEALVADIRKIAAKQEDWDITGVIDGLWYKRKPFMG